MTANAPKVSVVIAAVNGRAALAECLAGLQRQQGDVAAEVIVVEPEGSEVAHFVRPDNPNVRFVTLRGLPSIPRLRAAGIHVARGDIIAITEDHCIPWANWYASIRRAHAYRAAAAIGGAVDNAATTRLVDWAVYFCEYSRFASPLREGPCDDLPAPNVSYKRQLLLGPRPLVTDEYWETVVHQSFKRLGYELWCDPSLGVDHLMHFGFWSFVVERYHYGRAFAAQRNPSLGWAGRALHVALSPALIPLFLLRIGRNVLARRQHWFRFARCVPMICCFTAAAAVGEGVGHTLGAGDSALRMR